MPVQRIVGGVEVEGDLRWRRRVGVEKQINKQPLAEAARARGYARAK